MECFQCGSEPEDNIYYRIEGEYYCVTCCEKYYPEEHKAWMEEK
jgi:hypothetical protein